jgi:hypothetical protein
MRPLTDLLQDLDVPLGKTVGDAALCGQLNVEEWLVRKAERDYLCRDRWRA